MSSIDQQFVEFIVKTLVNKPEAVSVERIIDERGVLLSLSVDPEDVGRVIGKRGATAQALRALLRVLGTKNDARYNLKIVNTDGYEAGEHSDTDGNESASASAADTEVEASDESESESDSELAEKTRAELADLDDLEI